MRPSFSLETFQKSFALDISHPFEQSLKEEVKQVHSEWVRPGGALKDANQALAVHRECYLARLTEVLGDVFEGIWIFIGDEAFFQVCRDYIYTHPSKSYSLSHYGENFPRFLGAHGETCSINFLQSLGEMEWDFQKVFHGPGHSPLGAQGVAKLLDNPQLKLQRGRGVMLFQYPFAVHKLWKQLKAASQGEGADAEMGIEEAQTWDEIPHSPQHLAFVRILEGVGHQIYSYEISSWEYDFLQGLEGAMGLEQMLLQQQKLIELHGLGEKEIQEAFASWVQKGFLQLAPEVVQG